jgi:hypothetical protein
VWSALIRQQIRNRCVLAGANRQDFCGATATALDAAGNGGKLAGIVNLLERDSPEKAEARRGRALHPV